MRRRTYVSLVGTAALGGCSSVDTSRRTGTPTDSGGTASFQKQWEADLEDDDSLKLSDFQATADAETAYLGTESELTALSLADGTEQWTLSLDAPLDGITIDDDGLYTLQDRTVQAVDPATGESRWASTGGGVEGLGVNEGSVATTDEHAAARGTNGVIIFGKESGQQTARLSAEPRDSVRAGNGQFVVADYSAVTAYDPDGTAQWSLDDVPVAWLTPVAGSTVVGGGSGTFVGIDLESGTQAWTTEASAKFTIPKTAGTGDTVFVYPTSGDSETFYALNADTGAVRWEKGDIRVTGFPPVVLESAVVVDFDEGVQARDPKTGEQIASSDEFGNYEATGSGRTIVVYSSSADAYRL